MNDAAMDWFADDEISMPPRTDPETDAQDDARDEVRWGAVSGLQVCNQEIIEDAYFVSDFLGLLAAQGGARGLFFEQANCFNACFHRVKRWLKLVDPEYLRLHPRLVEFFAREGWDSSSDRNKNSGGES